MQALKTALTRQGVVHFSHTCCKTGAWATRPSLHQHRLNVGPTWASRPRLHQHRPNVGSTWRLALVCINVGPTWATRPSLHQPPLNVGDSPKFAPTSASTWASRPRSYHPISHSTVAATSSALSPICCSQNSSMSSCSGAANEIGPSGKLNT